MSKERMVTIDRLAKMLGVHVSTVHNWIRQKLIFPGRRVGRYRVWTSEEAQVIRVQAETVHQRFVELRKQGWPKMVRPHVWSCPGCTKVERTPAVAFSHMKGCPGLWHSADVQEVVKKTMARMERIRHVAASAPTVATPAPMSSATSRTDLLTMAGDVIDGTLDPQTFAAAAQGRLDRIQQIEEELQTLRAGG